MVRVKDVMTNNVITCRPHTNLAEAGVLMWDHDFGSLPVVDDEQRLIGIITDRDICIATATKNRLASDISVGEVMSTDIFTCAANDEIRSALQLMSSGKVRRLPVVMDGNIIQGILSLNDLALRTGEVKGKAPDVSFKELSTTVKALCEHEKSKTASSI